MQTQAIHNRVTVHIIDVQVLQGSLLARDKIQVSELAHPNLCVKQGRKKMIKRFADKSHHKKNQKAREYWQSIN